MVWLAKDFSSDCVWSKFGTLVC